MNDKVNSDQSNDYLTVKSVDLSNSDGSRVVHNHQFSLEVGHSLTDCDINHIGSTTVSMHNELDQLDPNFCLLQNFRQKDMNESHNQIFRYRNNPNNNFSKSEYKNDSYSNG